MSVQQSFIPIHSWIFDITSDTCPICLLPKFHGSRKAKKIAHEIGDNCIQKFHYLGR